MKRIVICADGTWNEPEKRDEKTGRIYPTNVLKVARAVRPRSADGLVQTVYMMQAQDRLAGLISSLVQQAIGQDNQVRHA